MLKAKTELKGFILIIRLVFSCILCYTIPLQWTERFVGCFVGIYWHHRKVTFDVNCVYFFLFEAIDESSQFQLVSHRFQCISGWRRRWYGMAVFKSDNISDFSKTFQNLQWVEYKNRVISCISTEQFRFIKSYVFISTMFVISIFLFHNSLS